tara:strand:- start:523 stop:843 length:321 start_codon:yes stop_codon:yes gene_type:complete
MHTTYLVEMAANVDDKRTTYRLAALGGSCTTRKHRNVLLPGYFHDYLDIFCSCRKDNAEWFDLVVRSISREYPTCEGIKTHFSFHYVSELLLEPRISGLDIACGHG